MIPRRVLAAFTFAFVLAFAASASGWSGLPFSPVATVSGNPQLGWTNWFSGLPAASASAAASCVVTGTSCSTCIDAGAGAGRLIAFFNLDQDAGNNSDTTFSGTLVPTASFTTATPQTDGGYSLSLNGGYDQLAGSVLLSSVSDSWSIAVWVKPTTLAGNYEGLFTNVDDTCGLYLRSTGATDFYFSATDRQSTTTIGTGAWSHLVIVYKGTPTNQYQFYINGTPETAVAATGLGAGCMPTKIGAPLFPYNGSIDMLGVWARALTSTEVTSLYNSGAGLAYPFTNCPATPAAPALFANLLAYYKLDGNPKDQSGVYDGIDSGTAADFIYTNDAGIINQGLRPLTQQSGAIIPGFDGGGIVLGPTWTVSAWVYVTQQTSLDGVQGFWLAYDTTLARAMKMSVYQSSVGAQLYSFNLFDSSLGSCWEAGGGAAGTRTVSTGWHNIVVTFDDPNLSLNIDGAYNTTCSARPGRTFSFRDIGFAAGNAGVFQNSIDEVGVWNRVLSQANLITLWNDGGAVTYP